RLRAGARVEFYLQEPHFEPVVVRPLAPIIHGDRARPALVALFGLGCDACRRGTNLLARLVQTFGDRIHVEAGEYFKSYELDSYRAALAARCAEEQGRGWDLGMRVNQATAALTTPELVAQAGALGLDGDAFAACLDEDRPLPLILENLALSERLGLERGIPAFFVHGVRLDDL